MLVSMDQATIIRALGALAQEHRLAAFRLLVEAGPQGLPAGTIAAKLGMAASTMSFHLAALAQAGLVSQQRQSRQILYAADYGTMNTLIAYLTENCCGGVPCVTAAPCCPEDSP